MDYLEKWLACERQVYELKTTVEDLRSQVARQKSPRGTATDPVQIGSTKDDCRLKERDAEIRELASTLKGIASTQESSAVKREPAVGHNADADQDNRDIESNYLPSPDTEVDSDHEEASRSGSPNSEPDRHKKRKRVSESSWRKRPKKEYDDRLLPPARGAKWFHISKTEFDGLASDTQQRWLHVARMVNGEGVRAVTPLMSGLDLTRTYHERSVIAERKNLDLEQTIAEQQKQLVSHAEREAALQAEVLRLREQIAVHNAPAAPGNEETVRFEEIEIKGEAETKDVVDLTVGEDDPASAAINPADSSDLSHDKSRAIRMQEPVPEAGHPDKRNDFFARMKVVLDRSDPNKVVLRTKDDLSASFESVFNQFFAALNSYTISNWQIKIFTPGFATKSSHAVCIRKSVAWSNKHTKWSHGEGMYACDECVKIGLPCFTKVGKEFWMLPLHEADMERQIGAEDLVPGRYVVPGRFEEYASGKVKRNGRPTNMISKDTASKKRSGGEDQDEDEEDEVPTKKRSRASRLGQNE
ncbi:hypothetical protein LTR10_000829 [Elasticomyces elasticus]|nr:hypothetical protein LTR10_000829 [Elasticomyces elasticus]KAK4979925.1 hypothetical protein LTR42_000232 [Elasticomyces elasticus]